MATVVGATGAGTIVAWRTGDASTVTGAAVRTMRTVGVATPTGAVSRMRGRTTVALARGAMTTGAV
ncbi:MAG TPA: hypothetical protein VGK33_13380, partial [Chloroflexota bacterium]